MQLTKDYLEQKFNEFNQAYFKGELKTPAFEIFKSRRTNGQYHWETDWCGNIIVSIIRISNYYDCSEFDYCNTLIHEMIHLYIRQNNIKDTRPHHGRVFYSIADRINKEGGWNIKRCNSRKGSLTHSNQEFVVGAWKIKPNQYFVFVMSKEKIQYYLDWFDERADYFKDPIVFVSNNAAEFATYRTCRKRINGYYKTLDEFNQLFAEKTKLIFEGQTLSVCYKAG